MSQHTDFPAARERYNAAELSNERNYNVYDGIDAASRSHSPLDPPPSYDTLADFPDADAKDKKISQPSMSFEDSPAQLPYEDLIAGSSTRPARRSLPAPPPQQTPPPRSPHRVDQQPQPAQEPPQRQDSPPHPRTRPQLSHAARSAPDARGRARLEHIEELVEVDPFGNRFHAESPFEAGRRAQREGDGNPSDARPKGHAYVNGRMPSIKPGEIMPVSTMRPPNGVPPFSPPFAAPPFPPTIHTPIRPAHFPPEMHPPAPPLAREPSQRHAPPPQPQPSRSHSHLPPPPQPSRSQSHRHPPPPPPQPAPNPSYRSPAQPSALPQPIQYNLSPPAPLVPRRNSYDAHGIPPGLTPHGRYGAPPPPAVPPSMHPSSVPQSYPNSQPYPQAYPSDHPSRGPSQPQPRPQPQYQQPQPGRSILKDPKRYSLPASHSPLSTLNPAPVRLPSENVPPLNGVVHTPPAPSGSPHLDPSRAPRTTPKPVMPQLLAPLAAQDYNHRPQLQRSASAAPLSVEKGGLLSKTRSILRKRNSSSAVKMHADGAISFAPQSGAPMKRYENQMPALQPVREESGSGIPKLGKRLSKRR